MSIYGAAAEGAKVAQGYSKLQVGKAVALTSEFGTQTETAAGLLEKQIRLDNHKRNLDYALSAVEEILKNLTQIQP